MNRHGEAARRSQERLYGCQGTERHSAQSAAMQAAWRMIEADRRKRSERATERLRELLRAPRRDQRLCHFRIRVDV